MYSRMNVRVMMVALLLLGVGCEEWYQKDSHMISAQQFEEKVEMAEEKYKMVKYFTPNCRYCRFLKEVIDTLKMERQWSFEMYDLNCQWYPDFCMHHVNTGSFPYVAVYNTHGDLVSEIGGFYPLPVIRQIFEDLEAKIASENQRFVAVGLRQEVKVVADQNQALVDPHSTTITNMVVAVNQPTPIPNQPTPILNSLKPILSQPTPIPNQQTGLPQDPKNDQAHAVQKQAIVEKVIEVANPLNSEAQKSEPIKPTHPHKEIQHTSYFKYFFYICCVSMGLFYFYRSSLTQTKKTVTVETKVRMMPEGTNGQSGQAESEMQQLETLRDDQL